MTPGQELPLHARQAFAQLAAIEAIAGGRLDDARRALDELDELTAQCPVMPGRCRYCGCTRDEACAILIAPPFDDAGDAVIARCSWIDDHRTVCSNLTCMARWEREQPLILSASAEAGQSRIVLP